MTLFNEYKRKELVRTILKMEYRQAKKLVIEELKKVGDMPVIDINKIHRNKIVLKYGSSRHIVVREYKTLIELIERL